MQQASRWRNLKMLCQEDRLARTVPPLNPLHVFEVAARLGNFTKAAHELRVTQSAISRQVATLESYLGTKLFTRGSKGIALTQDGEAYWAEVGPAFSRISASTEALISRNKSKSVQVASYPTFAAKWLIPRLSGFSQRNPQIGISIKTSIAPVNFASNSADVAVQLRASEDMDARFSKLLFWDVIQPYCSPAYLRSRQIETIADLMETRMLHSYYRRSDWHDWLSAFDIRSESQASLEFPSSLLTYKAAAEGLGVVIGQSFLLREEVREGLLVPLFKPVKRQLAYYVTWKKNADAKARKFVRWLEDEIAKERPEGKP